MAGWNRVVWKPVFALTILLLALQGRAQTPAVTPTQQVPADVRAYRAARNAGTPEQRIAALRGFLHDYPESDSFSSARQALFDTLLKNFPDRLGEIDAVARQIVQSARPGYERWNQQMFVADELAGAGLDGVDLTAAEKWVLETDRQMTEARYQQAQAAIYTEYGAEPPKPEELHRMYRHKRAEVLLVRAHVLLKQGHLPQASDLLDRAAALEPETDELLSLRGEIALKQHRNAEALACFEQAQLLGDLPQQQHEAMLTLYRAAHNGSTNGLEEELDRRYAALYPPPFRPVLHTAASGGRTALLELFSGSGCGPCVGSDLAVDALLTAYPRTDVIALSLGEHVPLPDPLANPSTLFRGYSLGVESTPQYAFDGKRVHFGGADRNGAEALYRQIAAAVDKEIAQPAAAQLTLSVTSPTAGTLHVTAEVQLGSEAALRAAFAPAVDEEADEEAPAAATTPAAQQLIVRFALVEDYIRYSGENGIRFHRMVVRSLKRDSGAIPPTPGEHSTAAVNFKPGEVSRINAAYLTAYAEANDSFGPVQFLSTDTSMRPDNLAIAAWIEETTTHHVLQAAFTSVTLPTGLDSKN